MLEETTLPFARVTIFAVSITPSAPWLCTFSVPFGRAAVSFFTTLKAIGSSEVSSFAPARLIVITVDSSTFVLSEGVTTSCGSRVISPASKTDFTSVKLVPKIVR